MLAYDALASMGAWRGKHQTHKHGINVDPSLCILKFSRLSLERTRKLMPSWSSAVNHWTLKSAESSERRCKDSELNSNNLKNGSIRLFFYAILIKIPYITSQNGKRNPITEIP